MAHTAEFPSASHLLAVCINLESVEAGVSVETMTNFVSASGVELKDIYTL